MAGKVTPIISYNGSLIEYDEHMMTEKVKSKLRGVGSAADAEALPQALNIGADGRLEQINAVKQEFDRMSSRYAEKATEHFRAREEEDIERAARQSVGDAAGTVWEFIPLADGTIKLDSCTTRKETLFIPRAIDGRRISALGQDLLGRNISVREIVCPDTLSEIGACGFRFCENLRSVVFPALMDTFDPRWIDYCRKLEEITLPGMLETIGPEVSRNRAVKRLHIGPAATNIAPGAFSGAALEELTIDPANPHLETDGVGIYDRRTRTLVAVVRDVERYEVEEGCAVIGPGALFGRSSLKQVVLPNSLTGIGEQAFMRTGLTSAVIPPRVKRIGARAFMRCASLADVQLNNSLISIGELSFADTALSGVSIPASVATIHRSAFENTPLVFSGQNCNFHIDERSPHLLFDGNGGLYRREQDSLTFQQMLEPSTRDYTPLEGTVRIEPLAFAHHACLERIHLNEGLRSIGDGAFRICNALREVDIPSTLESIGAEAFLGTVVESLRIPASLTSIGPEALVTAGARDASQPPSLTRVDLNETNPAFYLHTGILCRRRAGDCSAVLFVGGAEEVEIPDEVTHIESYAFNNAKGIRTLTIGRGLRSIDQKGLAIRDALELITIRLAEPLDGQSEFAFRYPQSKKATHEMTVAIGGFAFLNLREVFAHYDNCLLNCHSYDPLHHDEEDMPAARQAKLILERLERPTLLTNVNRTMMESIVADHLEAICVDAARHDDRDVLRKLVDHGFIDGENVEQIVCAVRALKDASMTAYLLEVQRTRFEHDPFDLEI